MADTQLLTIALASIPSVLAVLTGILVNNSRLTGLRGHMDSRFIHMDHRFDDMRDTCRSEIAPRRRGP